jgi:hypothetical protein
MREQRLALVYDRGGTLARVRRLPRRQGRYTNVSQQLWAAALRGHPVCLQLLQTVRPPQPLREPQAGHKQFDPAAERRARSPAARPGRAR